MCYVYSSDFEPKGISFMGQSFSLEDDVNILTPADDGFDYDDSIVLRKVPGKDDVELVRMEWGFLPDSVYTTEEIVPFRNGYKDHTGRWQKGRTMLNARGEEMLNRGKVFRNAALHHRCLFPANGFYEPHHVTVTGKRGKPLKKPMSIPFHIYLPDRPVFWFPGVYNIWQDRVTGQQRLTAALATTNANIGLTLIHNEKKRMPTIPPESICQEWLFGRNISEHRISEIATWQIPWEEMRAYPVAKDYKKSDHPKQKVRYEEISEELQNLISTTGG